MFAKSTAAAAAALLASAALVVALAAPASAADVSFSSTSGRAAVFYNDPANSVTVCDLNNGDGVGARGSVLWNGATHGYRSDVTYNGCLTIWNAVPDGAAVEVRVCDWWWIDASQSRQNVNCNTRTFTA